MESFFSSLKTGRTAAKTYRSRDEAEADDVFDYIKRFYNARRRHSTIGRVTSGTLLRPSSRATRVTLFNR